MAKPVHLIYDGIGRLKKILRKQGTHVEDLRIEEIHGASVCAFPEEDWAYAELWEKDTGGRVSTSLTMQEYKYILWGQR